MKENVLGYLRYLLDNIQENQNQFLTMDILKSEPKMSFEDGITGMALIPKAARQHRYLR